MKKYFKTKKEANTEKAKRIQAGNNVSVFKMPKGTRHAGEFAVCSLIEFLNTY